MLKEEALTMGQRVGGPFDETDERGRVAAITQHGRVRMTARPHVPPHEDREHEVDQPGDHPARHAAQPREDGRLDKDPPGYLATGRKRLRAADHAPRESSR